MGKKLVKGVLSPASTDESQNGFDPHYLGYFECFNQQKYFEAHEVLEELWLRTKGGRHFFYKGLIQIAGAFVHLQKSKLHPAARLLCLARKYLRLYPPLLDGFDVAEILSRSKGWLDLLENSNYTKNPYNPKYPPRLALRKKVKD